MQPFSVLIEDTLALLLCVLLILREGLGLPVILKQASTVDPNTPSKLSDCREIVGLANCTKKNILLLLLIVEDNLVK